MKTTLKILGLLILLLAAAGAAFADQVQADGMTIAVTTVGNTSTLTIDTQSCNLANCNDLGDVSLKAFSGFTSLASWSVSDISGVINSNALSGPFSVVDGNQANGGCSKPGSGWICFNLASGLPTANGTYTFVATFNGASGPTAPGESVQVQLFSGTGIDCNNSTCVGDKRIDFISTETTGSQVPEPATLILFGSGLLGLARFVRRKL